MPRIDIGLAAVVWLAGICTAIGRAQSWTEWLIVAVYATACSIPLLWRSIAPLRIVVVIGALGLVGQLLPTSTQLDGPFLLAFALAIGTAGAADPSRRALLTVIAAALPAAVVGAWLTRDLGGSVLTLGWLALAFTIGRAIGFRRSYLAAQTANAQLERAREIERELAAERLAIARDLHDVIAQSVETVSMQATIGVHLFDSDPAAAREALVRIRAASTTTSRSIREMLGVMRAADQASDRLSGLDELAELVSSADTDSCSASFATTGEPRAVDPSIGPALYRVAQEALTNARRHAHATTVTVELAWRPADVALTITDDGIGAPNGLTEGYGLRGMRERLALIGGRLEIDTTTQRGFRVLASVPTEAVP